MILLTVTTNQYNVHHQGFNSSTCILHHVAKTFPIVFFTKQAILDKIHVL